MPLKVTGIATFLSSIEDLASDKTVEDITREALRVGGTILRDAIEQAAPVLDTPKTPNSTSLEPGDLKANIQLSVYKTDDRGQVVAVIAPSKKVRHVAGWVENGHDLVRYRRNAKGKLLKSTKAIYGRVRPHPFMRPAYEENRQKMDDAIHAELIRRINKIRGK